MSETACPVCDPLGMGPPDHPCYPNPKLGDEWHGQYDPDNPQELYNALTFTQLERSGDGR